MNPTHAGTNARRSTLSFALTLLCLSIPCLATPLVSAASERSLLYGLVTTSDDQQYEGLLRWRGGERFRYEPFDASKRELPYLEEYVADNRKSFEIFGRRFAIGWGQSRRGRRLAVAFSEIDRIEVTGREEATLIMRDGNQIEVEGGSDVGGTLTVLDPALGEIEIPWREIEKIDFRPTPEGVGASAKNLLGRLVTSEGTFEGPIQWDRQEQLTTDELDGELDEVSYAIQMGHIAVIEKAGSDASRIVLRDGRELELDGTNDVNDENRGIVVEDRRYGRVIVSWQAFERLEFFERSSSAGILRSGETTEDASEKIDRELEAAGDKGPLRGSVVRSDGEELSGRLVFDLDEEFGWERLDGRSEEISYSIPFFLVALIEPRSGAGSDSNDSAKITLRSGIELQLEGQDVGEANAGILVLNEGSEPVHVPWAEVKRIDFDGTKIKLSNPNHRSLP